jgi:hypothetical protein
VISEVVGARDGGLDEEANAKVACDAAVAAGQ